MRYNREIIDKINKIYDEYEFPILKLGKKHFSYLVGVSKDTLRRYLKHLGYSKKKELRKFFSTYPAYLYSLEELSDFLSVSKQTMFDYIKQHYGLNKMKVNKKYLGIAYVNKVKQKEAILFDIGFTNLNRLLICWFLRRKKISKQNISIFKTYRLKQNIYILRKKYGLIIEYNKEKEEYISNGFINSYFYNKAKEIDMKYYHHFEHIIKLLEERED